MPDLPMLRAGFRCFFPAAALWAGVALVLWLGMLSGAITLPSRFDPLEWHIHEMLFGFVMAGVGGFVLTAIPNWTSRPPVRGVALAWLLGLWGLGRATTLVAAWLPAVMAVTADLLFPAALLALAAWELVAAGSRRNFVLLVPIGLLGVANALMHLGYTEMGWRLGLSCVMVLITVIGGRIVPTFTRNWLRTHGGGEIAEPGRLDVATIVLTAVSLLAWSVFSPDPTVLGWVLLAASGLHLARLARWHGLRTRSEPLLAVLHVGYAWVGIGLGLLGASLLTDAVPASAAIHAMTAGAVGTMMLAVMTRATLGHTGRALHADPATIAIYALVCLAALTRLAAGFPSGAMLVLLSVSAVAWVAAFGLFVARYGPIALRRPAPARHDCG